MSILIGLLIVFFLCLFINHFMLPNSLMEGYKNAEVRDLATKVTKNSGEIALLKDQVAPINKLSNDLKDTNARVDTLESQVKEVILNQGKQLNSTKIVVEEEEDNNEPLVPQEEEATE
jgi:hypothetical protein